MFEIIDYKITAFKMEIDYVYGEYYYNVQCDFDWLDEYFNGYFLEIEVIPKSGTYFHELNDEKGVIEITDDYAEWLQDKVREYRNQTIWLQNESEQRMNFLNNNDYNYWCDYGI